MQDSTERRLQNCVREDHYKPLPNLDGASVLITGGTGSFGQAFVRHLLAQHSLERVVVFSRDEQKQFEMAQVLSPARNNCLRYFIGDVRDSDRLEMAMRDVDYVIHAAALKQVPVAEYNPFECIQTNVYGAENVVRAAIRSGVRRVIALSTDKAANPINLYGASKLASDKIFVAANAMSGKTGTRFAVVRYGNVLGSRGSVVPFFRRLMRDGATRLPITDPRMTRFWITLDQGVDFVLSSLDIMQGGEIFVPIIPSMRVVDLARAMAPDVEHDVIGVRPGEKLHETLITVDDASNTVSLGDRYIIEPSFATWERPGYDTKDVSKVPENFSYSSDANDHWLNADELSRLLKESGS